MNAGQENNNTLSNKACYVKLLLLDMSRAINFSFRDDTSKSCLLKPNQCVMLFLWLLQVHRVHTIVIAI